MVGLILIAFGTGGIKPCVAAFGGDQFGEDNVSRTATNNYFQILRSVDHFLDYLFAPQNVRKINVDQCFPKDQSDVLKCVVLSTTQSLLL